jgi:hypothetical protein
MPLCSIKLRTFGSSFGQGIRNFVAARSLHFALETVINVLNQYIEPIN